MRKGVGGVGGVGRWSESKEGNDALMILCTVAMVGSLSLNTQ